MRLDLLGPLRLTVDGRETTVPGPGERALLALLGLRAGHRVGADTLIEALWAGQLPADPANALQTRVSKLRRRIGDALVTRPGGYELAVEAAAVDIHRFRRLVAEHRHREALDLWRGRALEDFAGTRWADAAAVALEEERLTALERWVEAELAAGRHRTLIAELERLVAEHPTRERLVAQLMVALHRSGRQADALAVHREIRARLSEELGLDPSPDLRDLEAAILRRDPLVDAPPGESPATDLPAPLTALVGRAAELTGCAGLLERHRLVTLTGPGGAGKTALGLEVARRVAVDHADGAWFVRLADVSEADRVAQRVCDAVGIPGTGDRPPQARLAAYLAPRRALLVLDNCEHVVGAAAWLAQHLLEAAPSLRLLTTSRAPLGVPGEVLREVPPLPPADAATLFAQRARAVRRDWVVDETTRPVVAEICRRLDGLPLAIELAAARSRSLSVRAIAERLDDRFGLLTSGARTAEPRHRTLDATVAWSHELLEPPEAALLRRLSVFRGAPALEDIEAVCAGHGIAREQVLDVLDRLVDQSLVVAEHDRFRLLETIRVFAAQRLADAGEAARLRTAHARHYRAVAARAESALRGPRQASWLRRLKADDADLQAALAWERAHAGVDPDEVLTASAGLAWFWFVGRHGDGRAALRAALDAAPAASPAARARALQALSIVERPGGCIVHPGRRAHAPARESLELFRRVGDERRGLLSQVLCAVSAVGGEDVEEHLGVLAAATARLDTLDDGWTAALADFVTMEILIQDGRIDAAVAPGARGRERFDAIGDRWGTSAIDEHLGHGLRLAGRPSAATGVLQRSLDVALRVGLTNVAAGALLELALVAIDDGDDAAAQAALRRGRAFATELGNVLLTAMADVVEASRLLLAGDAATARALAEPAAALLRGEEATAEEAEALCVAASCVHHGGDRPGAARLARAALEAAVAVRDRGLEARALEVLAAVNADAGDVQRATGLLDRAERLRQAAERPGGALEAAERLRTRGVPGVSSSR